MNTRLILLAGPSGSGKSTLAQILAARLGESNTQLLELDHYYRDLSHLEPEERATRDFDCPGAWESERLIEEMHCLLQGQTIAMPQYDFCTHLRKAHTRTIEPRPFIIAEGLFALCYAELNAIATLKVFVDLDDARSLERRLLRDVVERGRSRESVIQQFNATVAPANRAHIRPSSAAADTLLDGQSNSQDSVDLLYQQITSSEPSPGIQA